MALEQNQLDVLSPYVCAIHGLQRLQLAGNNLTSLPYELENLVFLKQLLLDDNEFEVVPVQVRNSLLFILAQW